MSKDTNKETKPLAVVTGGAGFVGSHLCERLVKEGYSVISLDNYFTGSKENHVEGVEYREGHTKDIAGHIPETPSIIYHLGEYSRVHKSLEEPEVVLDLNIVGTLAVVNFWKTHGCKLVYTASSTKDDMVSKAADGTLGKNLAPYTWAKAINVDLINNYGKWFSLPYAITYFFNVYGPRERAWGNYGTVIETFRQNSIQCIPHKVNAPGTQTRAFTHVLDTIDGIVLVGEKGSGDGFNICAQDVCSIKGVAELFGGEIEVKPQTKTSRSAQASDTSQIEQLGWKQKHTLKQYVEECKQ
ncbi:ADP-L-glycero-D-manno-heptose-6-epimerase [Candidatus Kaiserbacteria bacterium CG10_big_fil_rev_8_21_14_0_10_45_20]|uniref:ADP-L-glycero-D-manno-heptose-6-epimerase n=1 Tax=Candidatus Kaiserbacteria bacterium CG10_big_fil_rev_8_21_14_0_10_45_20 TaxID=1974607 RepID=A0A2H0UHQ0_9BACT|nr:MAG: ADP-L-glycero-D-manno-heptose-6-epimerase [Candidatus Kaiserbacteria bacterium CG10_big_fil_rev_8_21_14_0_10_45_20]